MQTELDVIDDMPHVEPVTDTAAWKARRRWGIGASEAAAALGLDPWCSPLKLYFLKTGELPEPAENEAMLWGRLHEPTIAAEYQRRTGRELIGRQLFIGGTAEPHLFATVDGLTRDRVVEFKTISAWQSQKLGDEGTDELPEPWLIQAHVQMYRAHLEVADFAVLVGGNDYRPFEVRRDDDLMRGILPPLRDFWGHVVRREPPAPDPARDASLLHLLYPGCDGEVELDEHDLELLGEYTDSGAALARLQTVRAAKKAALLCRLGDHAIGLFPDGRRITRKVITVPQQTIVRRKYSYTGMWVSWPKGGGR